MKYTRQTYIYGTQHHYIYIHCVERITEEEFMKRFLVCLFGIALLTSTITPVLVTVADEITDLENKLKYLKEKNPAVQPKQVCMRPL